MTVLVTALRLDPGAAEVLITPHWASRALAAITGGRIGRRSYMRRAVPVAPGMTTWRFDDGRCEVVDDETHKAIVTAVIRMVRVTLDVIARVDDARFN